ncbi:MAG: acyltransferase [Gammaproteobacteria bacterium]|nr:acyltransferase [Gammaproteobacteria bacterium]
MIEKKLQTVNDLLGNQVDCKIAREILNVLEIKCPDELLKNLRIYSDVLPIGVLDDPYTVEQRYLHFIWDAFANSVLNLMVDFYIPFKRMIAAKLFKKCGNNFICDVNVSFNFGHRIAVGDNVFFNRNVYIDSKGGLEVGDSVGITEDVMIFTHSHSEAQHTERSYAPVVIKDFAKIYSRSIILPGVTIGEQALVAANSVVTKDVPPNTLVAGSPARIIRERKNDGLMREDLEHYWFHNGEFQR